MIDILCVGNSLSYWFITPLVEFSTGEFRAKQVFSNGIINQEKNKDI